MQAHKFIIALMLLICSSCKPIDPASSLQMISYYPENDLRDKYCQSANLSNITQLKAGSVRIVSARKDLCRSQTSASFGLDQPGQNNARQRVAILITNPGLGPSLGDPDPNELNRLPTEMANLQSSYEKNNWKTVPINLSAAGHNFSTQDGQLTYIREEIKKLYPNGIPGDVDIVYAAHGDVTKSTSANAKTAVNEHVTDGDRIVTTADGASKAFSTADIVTNDMLYDVVKTIDVPGQDQGQRIAIINSCHSGQARANMMCEQSDRNNTLKSKLDGAVYSSSGDTPTVGNEFLRTWGLFRSGRTEMFDQNNDKKVSLEEVADRASQEIKDDAEAQDTSGGFGSKTALGAGTLGVITWVNGYSNTPFEGGKFIKENGEMLAEQGTETFNGSAILERSDLDTPKTVAAQPAANPPLSSTPTSAAQGTVSKPQ